jgi:hypothetical protein
MRSFKASEIVLKCQFFSSVELGILQASGTELFVVCQELVLWCLEDR